MSHWWVCNRLERHKMVFVLFWIQHRSVASFSIVLPKSQCLFCCYLSMCKSSLCVSLFFSLLEKPIPIDCIFMFLRKEKGERKNTHQTNKQTKPNRKYNQPKRESRNLYTIFPVSYKIYIPSCIAVLCHQSYIDYCLPLQFNLFFTKMIVNILWCVQLSNGHPSLEQSTSILYQ